MHIFGEIISAKNFDYDDVHVYYQLDLPKSNNLVIRQISFCVVKINFKNLDWHVDKSSPISGFTQTSRIRTDGNDETAYFSHPFEYDLYYKNDEMNELNRGRFNYFKYIFNI